jgi:hypothetical protein
MVDYSLTMNAHATTQPVPLYGLAGGFNGVRWIEGEGRDQRTVGHRCASSPSTVTVGVDRRIFGHRESNAPGTPLPDDPARLAMATALVVDLPKIGNAVFEISAEVADDANAWQRCQMAVDGQVRIGYERQYGGRCIAYCLTSTLILYVLAPAALQLDDIELRKLESEEVAHRPPDETE